MKIGDVVIKGSEVLRIVERKSEAVGEGPAKEYWLLEKAYVVGRSGFMLHVPIERENDLLRPAPGKAEFESMLAAAKEAGSIPWIKDRMKRIDAYHKVVASGDITEMLRLCQTFAAFREGDGATLSTRDRDFEKKAHEFVTAAGAVALEIEPDEATALITSYFA